MKRGQAYLVISLLTLAVLVSYSLMAAGAGASPRSPDQQTEAVTPTPVPSAGSEPGVAPMAGPSLISSATPGVYYISVAGSAFQPRDSATTYDYGGTGCIYRTAGTDLFVAAVFLPNGATISEFRFYYYDTVGDSVEGWLTSYDMQGTHDDLLGLESTGTAGYGYADGSLIPEHDVDNVNNAYVVMALFNASDSGLRFCGARIGYHFSTYAPLIMKNY